MEWRVMLIIALVGAMLLLFFVLELAISRLLILLRKSGRKEAMQRSIDKSLLHKLGGGGSSPQALWIMVLLSMLMVIYQVTSLRPFDLFALLDTMVAGCLVFVLANVVRLVITRFIKRPAPSQAMVEVSKEQP